MNKICRPKRTAISIAIATAIASGWTGSYAGTTNGDPNLGDGAIATGNGSRAVGDYSVAIGSGGTAADVNAIVLGTAAVAQANAVAVGTGATAVATAIALGANSSATALAAIALGQGAGAVNAGDVAIGAGSVTAAARAVPRVTVAGRIYDLAGSTPASVVSLGAVGAERQLTNVAAGTISAASTDAVNGSELYAAYQAIEATSTYATSLSASTAQSVVSLSTGVAATGTALTALSTSLAAGTIGLVQQAGGAPGAGTITIGATTGGTTVDISGTDGARRINGIAAGRDTTDAVNVAQLNQVAGAVNTVASNAVSYDDPTRASVTLGGLHATSSVLMRNVASGALSATSTDAVNGAQLFATNQAVQANTSAITELASHVGRIQASVPSQTVQDQQGNLKFVAVNSSGTPASAIGPEAVAVGGSTLASGTGSTAIGSGAHVSGNGSIAIGSNATAPANNAVALGPGTHAERDDTVSFGNAATGLTRTLSNVSAGIAPSDAVNVQQLNDSVGSVRNQIEHDRRDANGGTASAVAIASLPQAPSPGTSMVAIGGVS
ncbi:YadA family autotransporter adhesin [Burkholderia ubonensis]|uniref:YadA family autotransporter adhesin n=1 Tax=Burkholderia ubonensis TaxID=101571 RepID=UPI000AF460FB|nr:peptide ABC transporter permease [Burkholderia ubonensis]